MWVSTETIYQSLYVQSRGALKRGLAAYLRTGRAVRRPSRKVGQRKNRIPNMINTTEHPPEGPGVRECPVRVVHYSVGIGRPVAQPFVRPISSGTTGRVWAIARRAALTEGQQVSPLARRPYDLRHACVSTWLAAGVAPTQVARWAGHSVAVLLRVYAHCVDGQEATALRQIKAAPG